MAYKNQVSDLKTKSTIGNIAGVCLDSEDFLLVLNEVLRRLLRRGRWDDTCALVRLCVYDACVTWPRYVGTVLGARFCDGQLADIQNQWYSITGRVSGYQSFADTAWPLRAPNDLGAIVFEDGGRGPTYKSIGLSTGMLLRYYVRWYNDIGKKITIYGKQYGGQPLQHQDSDGNWIDGMVLTAAAPYATSATYVTEITSVVREATQGMSYLYGYDPATDKLRDLAIYEPGETNPSYRKSIIRNWCQAPGCTETVTVSGTDYERRKTTIEALVKLNCFDVVSDNDFLLVDNYEAIKLAFQAVKLEEQNEDTQAEVKWLKAVRELNFDLRDKSPDETTPVFVNSTNCVIPIRNPY